MTLAEMSKDYEESARLLRQRLRLLRKMAAETDDPEELWHIQRRIAVLTPMLTQMNELAELTPCQKQTLTSYYFRQLTIPQIAKEQGVNKSTVSRTLRRAEDRVRRCLRY